MKLNHRPRVGLDLHVVNGKFQGSRTHCLELFSRVISRTPDIDYIGFVEDPAPLVSFSEGFRAPNIQFVVMKHCNPLQRLLFELPKLSREHGIDLLHGQYIAPPLSPCATTVTIHDILFETHPQFFGKLFRLRSQVMMRLSAWKSAMVFTVSEFSRRAIMDAYKIAPERIHAIPNGADRSRFYPGVDGADALAKLGLARGKYILSVGRLEPRKNHVGLLTAYERMVKPRPKLVIAGQRDFGYTEALNLLSRPSLKNDVLVLENVSDELITVLYRNALLFAYPTWAEGFGMPVLEAMAAGVPVLTSNTTALPEVGGDAVLYVNPADTNAIRSGIERLINDADLRRQLSEKGLQRSTTMNWEESADIVSRSYRNFFGLATTEEAPEHCLSEGTL